MSNDDALAPTVAGSGDATAATTRGDAPRDSRVTLEIGKRLGDRYDVRGYLGEGGMGAVYRAFDSVLGEEVALKVVRGAFAQESGLRDEVRIAQKVTHKNVCRTYDLEDLDGFHLVKMEYVAGETLAVQIAERGAFAVERAVRIAREIAAGLDAAHAEGIVHRDLKPGNVMLAGERVVLMDFGLACKITDEETDRSGTPGYMSPEQLAGGAVDHRSDLYALGCLLYEMLTGERAFAQRGSMTEIASQRANMEAPALRVRRPDAPKWLANAVAALMAKSPDDRTRGLEMLRRGPRRVPWVPVLVAGAAVLATGAAIGLTGDDTAPAPKRETPKVDFQKLRIEAPAVFKDRPAFSPSGTRLAYFAARTAIYQVPFPDGGEPKLVADLSGHEAYAPRWMRTEWNFLVTIDSPDGMRVHVLRNGELGPAAFEGYDADDCGGGTYVALVNPQKGKAREGRGVDPALVGDALVLYRDGLPALQLLAPVPGEELDHPRCDREGKRVVFKRFSMRNPGIFLVETSPGAKPVQLTKYLGDHMPTFTHDGSVVFVREVEERGQLHEVAAKPNSDAIRLTYDARDYMTPEVSSVDRDVIVVGVKSKTTGVFFRDEKGERLISELELDDLQLVGAKSIVATNGDKVVRIDVDEPTVRELATGRTPFVSLDGTRVFYVAGTEARELWVVPLAGGKAEKVVSMKSKITGGADGHGGQHLAVIDPRGVTQSYFVAPGKEPVYEADGLVIPSPSGELRAVFHPGDNVRFMKGTQLLEHPDLLPCAHRPVWMDAQRIACMALHAPLMHVHTLGVEGMPKLAPPDPAPMDASALRFVPGDDKRWLVVRRVDKVDYYRSTNFARRAR